MVVAVKRVRDYNPKNSTNFCAIDYNGNCTLSGAFSKILSTYDKITDILDEFEDAIPPVGFTANREYYSHIMSFVTGEILFFVKVNPDRSIRVLTTQQYFAGVGFDS